MRETFYTLLSLFSRAERRRIGLLLAIAAADGLIQAVGIASIMPFIAILADPSLSQTSPFFQMLLKVLPHALSEHLAWVLGILALSILVVSNALSVLNYWLSLRLFNAHGYRLSTRLLSIYLQRDLLDFNRRKITEMSTTILSEVERVVINTLMAGVGLVADGIVAVTIVGLLLFVNPWATVGAVLILGSGYLLVHRLIGREVERLGKAHAEAEAEMFAGLSQALAMFKEAKLSGTGAYFLDGFARPARRVTGISNRYEILRFVPAQIIEVLAFAMILMVALYFTSGRAPSDFNAMALIAFYAFAAYRLVPLLKSLLDGLEEIQYGAGVVDKVLAELAENGQGEPCDDQAGDRLPVSEGIHLERLAFRYPDASGEVFSGLDAWIPAGRLTCIQGPSGAGKSTLLDILLGLIEPTEGRCLVDGQPLGPENRVRWQRGLGYVPQQVQLVAGSLARNIALGEARIDEARVEAAARAAGIHRLASEQLALGYETPVGDGGHALSSGERQRVGIARALYRDPDLLILDEATNELDAATEEAVLSHLLGLAGKTIVFATHKVSVCERAACVIQLAGRFA